MSEHVIALPSDVRVKDVADVKALLNGSIDEQEVCLDADALNAIDGAGLQLLIAFVAQKVRQEQTVVWKNISETLENAVSVTGTRTQLLL